MKFFLVIAVHRPPLGVSLLFSPIAQRIAAPSSSVSSAKVIHMSNLLCLKLTSDVVWRKAGKPSSSLVVFEQGVSLTTDAGFLCELPLKGFREGWPVCGLQFTKRIATGLRRGLKSLFSRMTWNTPYHQHDTNVRVGRDRVVILTASVKNKVARASQEKRVLGRQGILRDKYVETIVRFKKWRIKNAAGLKALGNI